MSGHPPFAANRWPSGPGRGTAHGSGTGSGRKPFDPVRETAESSHAAALLGPLGWPGHTEAPSAAGATAHSVLSWASELLVVTRERPAELLTLNAAYEPLTS